MKFTKEEIALVQATVQTKEQDAVLELSTLELAIVGGGSGEISPY